MCKRPLQDSGANGNKRQRLPGDDSEIIESEESEALPENYAGDTSQGPRPIFLFNTILAA
jgi:hypothetical protein